MAVTPGTLQAYANHILSDEECMQEIRDRMTLRMMKRFRSGNPEEREIINSIMDNEVAFFDELKSILDDAVETKDINDDSDDKGQD